jgi:hypothetical protein
MTVGEADPRPRARTAMSDLKELGHEPAPTREETDRALEFELSRMLMALPPPVDVQARVAAARAALVPGERREVSITPFPLRKDEPPKPYAIQSGYPMRVLRVGISRGVRVVEMSIGPASQGRRSDDPQVIKAREAGLRTRRYFTPAEIQASAFREERVLEEDSVLFLFANESGDDLLFKGALLVEVDPLPEPDVVWGEEAEQA